MDLKIRFRTLSIHLLGRWIFFSQMVKKKLILNVRISKTKNRKIDFSYISEHWQLFGQKSEKGLFLRGGGGGVCTSLHKRTAPFHFIQAFYKHFQKQDSAIPAVWGRILVSEQEWESIGLEWVMEVFLEWGRMGSAWGRIRFW